jgi:hypothetical protein
VRLMEIASATEQMALWKLINTSVWQAIEQQQRQEAQRQQARRAQSKSRKVRGGVGVKTTPVPRVPTPVPTQAPPKAQVPNKIVNPSVNPSAIPSTPQAHMYPPNTNPSKPSTITPVKTTQASAVHNANARVLPSVKTHRKFNDDELVHALKPV